jgi:general nucleoside transport system ATP-binding protein
MPPEIEMTGIVKCFGDLVADNHVDFAVEKGEIRALVGENGAGKTTLMRILFGLYRPNAGKIKIRGQEVTFASPHDAIAQRIGMVHQHFMLFNDLTVTDNIIYGMEPSRLGFVDQKKARAEVVELARSYGFTIKPDALLSVLSVGERQRVEILKTLYRGADVIILDEPTAVLTPQERNELFSVLRNLSRKGKTIILITHKLGEVMELSQRATVLRRGKLVGTVETNQTTIEELACMMVGREVFLKIDKSPVQTGEPVLSVRDLTITSEHRTPLLNSVSFEIYQGEIVGLAGVAGNGQTELVDALVGFIQPNSGIITLNGVNVTHQPISRRREMGIAYIPEDRYARGLAVTESVAENLAMGFQHTQAISYRGVIQQHKIQKWAASILKQFDVRLSNPNEVASNLSGGNLQKMILAREFSHPARFILADQPTRGVDIGATEFIYQQLVNRRNLGDGVLFISADLNEIISVSDRILVIFAGKIVKSIPASQTNEEELGLLMAGSQLGNQFTPSALMA